MSLWVGTYAERGGGGLYPVEIRGCGLHLGQPEPSIANASFGLWSRRHSLAYFVDEQEAGPVTASKRIAGGWEEMVASGSGGALPCFLALHPPGTHLVVANYADGSVALLRLDPRTGLIRELVDVQRPSGSGADAQRQRGPHAHCVRFSEDGRSLYGVDLGLDLVVRCPLAEDRLGAPTTAFAAPPGSGPRHLLFQRGGKTALLLTELSAELFLLDHTAGGGFACVDRVALLPEPCAGDNLGGHLKWDRATGDALVTNRGHDSLVAFAVRNTALRPKDGTFTGGASPRHFWSAGKVALVAHEESGTVSLVSRSEGDRAATPMATVTVPGAAFVLEMPG
jgi:6-phosphogluconolactonase